MSRISAAPFAHWPWLRLGVWGCTPLCWWWWPRAPSSVWSRARECAARGCGRSGTWRAAWAPANTHEKKKDEWRNSTDRTGVTNSQLAQRKRPQTLPEAFWRDSRVALIEDHSRKFNSRLGRPKLLLIISCIKLRERVRSQTFSQHDTVICSRYYNCKSSVLPK